MPAPLTFAHRYQLLRQNIQQIALQNQRDPQTIQLIAVTKTQPLSAIEAAIAAGQQDFGENYIKEALFKIEALKKYPLTWHFIGPIQSNKTKEIAQYFDWVHSLDREKIARRLAEQRPAEKPPLNVCIEVNIGNEGTKAGVAVSEISALAEKILNLPQLKLRGLMALPPMSTEVSIQTAYFKQVRLAFEALYSMGYHLDTLSMGTSHDYPAAIAQGATFLRIGTALFGSRH